jgi:regulator of sigma E protease
MIVSFLYIFLAILGLSFLIFIHELGHYFMAKRVGMRVETFAIGFGRPIYSWMVGDVKWQIGWLLFGGYVKILGQDSDEKKDPYEIPDGFFGKRPIERIKVALAGPLVNIVFAFIFFALVWVVGGREKSFTEYTHKIGWVDPKSELYADGVRPGDEIVSYNDQEFQGMKDHTYAPMTSGDSLDVKGMRVDYATGQKTPFEYKIKPYPRPNATDKGILTSGVINSANYVIYDRLSKNEENPLPEGSPMIGSGIEYGDRVVWADGEIVFSHQQLSQILNDNKALLTIRRDGNTMLLRAPRVPIEELKLDSAVKEELSDWQYEANLNNTKFGKLFYLPYILTNDGTVTAELKFIDKDNETEFFPSHPFSAKDDRLLPNDKIIAVDGVAVTTSYAILAQLQKQLVNVIVERGLDRSHHTNFEQADSQFDHTIDMQAIGQIEKSIGSNEPISHAGSYYLLKAIEPKVRSGFVLAGDKQALMNAEIEEKKSEIEKIDDPEKRAEALAYINHQEKLLLLGIPAIQDLTIHYNPLPWVQFENVFAEVYRTIVALFSGSLNPKWVSGPIGIIQVVHDNSMVSLIEALYWLGAISLNLGMLNLLPIPVLDGGTILMSLVEMVTGKRLSAKTMENLIFPFAALLIGFFVFLTYQDLSRLVSRYFFF